MRRLILVINVALAATAAQANAQGGVAVWTNRYNLPNYAFARANAYAIAVTSSNVYVSGTVYGSNNDYSYATVAYTTAGSPLWTNLYDGPTGGDDYVHSMAVDRSGNVIVTGGSYKDKLSGASDPEVFATIKYSGAGLPLWTNRFSTATTNAEAVAVAVASNGNVYVTGSLNRFQFDSKFATVAYSSAGTPLWTNYYSVSGADNATAIAVDNAGNVFVTGQSITAGQQLATVAYSSTGSPLWTNRYSFGFGSHFPWGIVADGSGHVFVTGQSVSEYVTIAYSTAGAALWTNRFNGPANDNDYSKAVTTDNAGNVLVTGASTGSGSGLDFATLKYSNAGLSLWTNRCNGPANGDDVALAITTDSSGNVFVTGLSTNINGSYSHDLTTAAYSAQGVPLWTNRYNGTGNGDDGATAIAVDMNGNVYVTGHSGGTNGLPDFVTIKYSSSLPPPHLDFQTLNNQLVLTWTNPTFALQSAPVVDSPFTNVAGAVSPYTNALSGPQQFFRLISN